MAERIPVSPIPTDKKELMPQESFVDQESPVGFEDKIQSLIILGKEKGMITFDDLAGILADEDGEEEFQTESIPDLIFERLEEESIPYIDEEQLDETLEETEDEKGGSQEDGSVYLEPNDFVGAYIQEISKIPLLTAEQEITLAKSIEKGNRAKVRLAEGNLNSKEFSHTISAVEDGRAAFEHLITANSRLVISVAKKYMERGVSFLDLIQEGNLGLIRAAKKFDYKRGYKFSTYSTWWIRQAITRAIADQGRTIRVPVHMGDQINRMLRANHHLTQTLGRDPTYEETAEKLVTTPKKVENMIQIALHPLSLESPYYADDDELTLGDSIEDVSTPRPPEATTNNQLREQLQEILLTLPPREVRILMLRYGFEDGNQYTLEEIGRKMGVTRERVRQVEAQAFHRLKMPHNKMKLRDYLRS